jgi:hypothetical protein
MKKLLLATLLISQSAFADVTYQLYCTGNRGKVAVLIEKIESKIRFTYTNIEGKNDFPIYEGVVTPSSMPFIKMAQKELSVIDNKLILEWNIEQCNKPTDNSKIISCDGEAKLIFPEKAKIKSFDFFTSVVEEKTPTFTYEIFKIRLGLDSENMHYLATMPFDPSNCSVKDELNLRK